MSELRETDWAAGYDMGRRHGYETATAELLRILSEWMKAGKDIRPLLPVVDQLRDRKAAALADTRGENRS